MAAYVKTIVDKDGNQIHPYTTIPAVTGLQTSLDNITAGAGHTFSLAMNGTNLSINLKNSSNQVLSTDSIDLNVTSAVSNAVYDDTTHELTLTFGTGASAVTAVIDVADMVGGLVPTSRTINGQALTSNLTLNASNIGYSGTTSGMTADDVQEAIDELSAEKAKKIDIAMVESTGTASVAHPSGSYFYYNNVLYEATADIAVNDAISVGTNCKSIRLADETNDLKSAFNRIIIPSDSNLINNIISTELEVDGLSVKIDNNTVILNGALNNTSDKPLRIKLSNGIEYTRDYTSPTSWNNERLENLKIDTYYYGYDVLASGTQSGTGAVMSIRDSVSASKISTSRSPYYYSFSDSPLAYIMFFVPTGVTYTNALFRLVLTETQIKEYPGELDVNAISPEKIKKKTLSEFSSELYKTITGTNLNAIQGMCIQDNYLYYGIVLNNTDGNNLLGKIDLSTGNIVATNQVSIGHCNGMTFNNKDGYIHVVALTNDGVIYRVSTDLQVVDSYTVDLSDLYSGYNGVGGIAYDYETDSLIYLIRGDRKGYAVYDGSLNFKNLFWSDFVSGNIYGDCCAYSGFIYQIVHVSNNNNLIAITNMCGKVVKKITIPIGFEAESIDQSNGIFYTSANKSTYDNHEIYKLTPINAEYLEALRC